MPAITILISISAARQFARQQSPFFSAGRFCFSLSLSAQGILLKVGAFMKYQRAPYTHCWLCNFNNAGRNASEKKSGDERKSSFALSLLPPQSQFLITPPWLGWASERARAPHQSGMTKY
jgi:hypothetical protein